ncbi:MAG: hypothetical protein M1823_002914 [Watsoniomyces obsoletus]|nr:MAG: hypothetical protein M1823_002914 [Watsoniomyces obsoletus]
MDGQLDIDELFADDGALSLPQVPPVKGLAQRIEELRTIGCCQKVAWSKLGCLAIISPDGRKVNVRNLQCSPDDGKWRLNRERLAFQANSAHEGHQLCHLAWNHSGAELAVVDVLGRIRIFQIVVAVNRLLASRPHDNLHHQEDDLGAVVGIVWLNTERPYPLYRAATRVGGQVQYQISQYRTMGPFHAPNRAALLAVTRLGMLRLLYQSPDSRWLEVTHELESLSSSNDVLTHASFCPDPGEYDDLMVWEWPSSKAAENSLLLAVQSMSRRHRLYRIQIRWTPGPPVHGSTPSVSAEVMVTPVKAALSGFEDVGVANGMSSNTSPVQPQLSHLKLLPVIHEGLTTESTFPTIMMVFSHLPTAPNPEFEESFSVIARWELQSTQSALHSQFDQLDSKGKKGSKNKLQEPVLRRLEDIVVDKTILSVQLIGAGISIAIFYSDGSIEMRDRVSFKIISAEVDSNKVTSLAQSGLSFPADEPCLHAALSQNQCVAVTYGDEGVMQLKTIKFMTVDSDETAALALAMQYAQSCVHYLNSDDVLAAVQAISRHANIHHSFLNEVWRALSQTADFTSEAQQDKVLRNTSIQRCLSAQDALGRHGGHRSMSSRVAWTALYLRYISSNLGMLMHAGIKSVGGGDTEFSKPDTLQSLFGLIRWTVDFVAFITDDLFDVLHTFLKSPPTAENLLSASNSLIKDRSNLGLAFILSSIPRSVLKHTIRYISLLCVAAQKGMQIAHDPEQRLTLRTVVDIIDGRNVAVKMNIFEKFLWTMDAVVGRSYQLISSSTNTPSTMKGNTTDTETSNTAAATTTNEGGTQSAPQHHQHQQLRDTSEKTLLLTSHIPSTLSPALQILIRDLIPALKREIEDPAAVYFGEYDHLGLYDPPSSSPNGDTNGGVKNGRRRKRKRKYGPTAVVVDVMRRVNFSREVVEGIDDDYDGDGEGNEGEDEDDGDDDDGNGRDETRVGLKKIVKWRRCTRCEAGMEDILPHMKGSFLPFFNQVPL